MWSLLGCFLLGAFLATGEEMSYQFMGLFWVLQELVAAEITTKANASFSGVNRYADGIKLTSQPILRNLCKKLATILNSLNVIPRWDGAWNGTREMDSKPTSSQPTAAMKCSPDIPGPPAFINPSQFSN